MTYLEKDAVDSRTGGIGGSAKIAMEEGRNRILVTGR
jgi:hypothetical protein